MSTDPTIVKPTPPLFDEARLAVAGFLARYSDATRASYAPTCAGTSPGAPSTTSRSSPPGGATSSSTPAPWNRGAWPGARSVDVCRP